MAAFFASIGYELIIFMVDARSIFMPSFMIIPSRDILDVFDEHALHINATAAIAANSIPLMISPLINRRAAQIVMRDGLVVGSLLLMCTCRAICLAELSSR